MRKIKCIIANILLLNIFVSFTACHNPDVNNGESEGSSSIESTENANTDTKSNS